MHIKGSLKTKYIEYVYITIYLVFSIVGPSFMKAASIINARVKMDTFDLSAIEIKSSDLKSFIKSLQAILSAN